MKYKITLEQSKRGSVTVEADNLASAGAQAEYLAHRDDGSRIAWDPEYNVEIVAVYDEREVQVA